MHHEESFANFSARVTKVLQVREAVVHIDAIRVPIRLGDAIYRTSVLLGTESVCTKFSGHVQRVEYIDSKKKTRSKPTTYFLYESCNCIVPPAKGLTHGKINFRPFFKYDGDIYVGYGRILHPPGQACHVANLDADGAPSGSDRR